MQQELIEMLEEIIQYVEVWRAQDQEVIDKAEALIEKAKNSAKEPAVPQGWRFKRNADDSIGIFAPPPKPGESQRTSHAVYPGQNRDLHEMLGKLADQQAATPAPAPAPEVGLTDSSIDRIVYEHTKLNPNQGADRALLTGIRHAVRDIIAALRAKENKL